MQKDDSWIHTACEMCRGSCGMLVHRVDGVVVDFKGDPDCPLNRGKLCSKGYAGAMSLYDPQRVKTPLRRTNPEKGLGVDPGWVPVSWEEALSILEEKLTKVRKEDPRELSIAIFDTYDMPLTIPSWAKAFGTPNHLWAGWQCGNYLHASMYLINGTFHCDFDAEHINYLMLFGNGQGFGVGLNPNLSVQKVAEARKRGLKVIVVDPICSNAAAKADEWVPIRPGTDAALALAMINVLLNDLDLYDRAFIKRYTNGPYLVKTDGYYMRQDGKPLIWDAAEGKAKPYDAEVSDYVLEGSYSVDGIECTPAFQLLKEHVKKYTPEMAAEITTIPAATIRRLAEQFGKEAKIGSTIVVDGVELPYRPAAANIYRGAGAHKHGVAAALSIMILNLVVGNLYVPGGHMGQNLVGPDWEWGPREYEGLVVPPAKEEVGRGDNFYASEVKAPETMNLKQLFPCSGTWGPMNLATTLDPEKYKLNYKPKVLLATRINLFMGGVDWKMVAEGMKKFEFVATFSTHIDEMAEFADLVLPETVALEKLQIIPNELNWSHTPQSGYWYWGIRQPVVSPVGDARDFFEVMMYLADKMGFLGDVYKGMNVRYELKEPYKLDPLCKYTWEEISDRRLKSQFGEEKGLESFKENGYVNTKRTVDEMYPLPWLKVRFPLYYENTKRYGGTLRQVTQGIGLKDWDISDYVALPDWKPCDSYTPSGDFDLKAVNFRVPTHAQSITAQNPYLDEVAWLNPYAQKILINTQTAKRKGIKDKDKICVESSVGKVTAEAKVTECIHPEALGISGHFGTLARGKAIAYGKGANWNKLAPYDLDPVGTGVDGCVKVKVYKI